MLMSKRDGSDKVHCPFFCIKTKGNGNNQSVDSIIVVAEVHGNDPYISAIAASKGLLTHNPITAGFRWKWNGDLVEPIITESKHWHSKPVIVAPLTG